ncbi:gamma-glutamylcyclotransferase [Clostridium chauvoei]|uniref:gamma-glutamylcyclotransferase family protein n=1 Tax=Clostridium chauvoei TaxID=46867 RepID=UPI00207AFBEF|nr:gamma-glutamylcyclotransferase family protein [Clostridium chauvoei]
MLEKDQIKVFTYGSLREGFFNYNKYLKGKVIKNRPAKVKDFILYHMPYKGYPAVLKGHGEVYGEVMRLSDYNEVMSAVDEMEGFISKGNPSNEYNKDLVEVLYEDGTKELCYSYIYNKEKDINFDKEAILVNSGDWKLYKQYSGIE